MDYNEFHKLESSVYNKYKKILTKSHTALAYCSLHENDQVSTIIGKTLSTFAIPALGEIAKYIDHGFTYSTKCSIHSVVQTLELCRSFAEVLVKDDTALINGLEKLQKDCEELDALVVQLKVANELLSAQEEKQHDDN